MLLINFLRAFWLVSFLSSVTVCYPRHCKCGYGGLCLYDEQAPCKCPEVSKGFYKVSDCSGIVHHCSRANCGIGECVESFGGYFCKCPKEYYGPTCQYHLPELSNIGLKNDLYIFYQVQPVPRERLYMHVIYNPTHAQRLTKGRVDVQVAVYISDGRKFYPTMEESSFKRKNLKLICLRQASKYPDTHDRRVCDMLPEGAVWAFTFNPALSTPLSEGKGKVYVPGIKDAVGRTGTVKVEVTAKIRRTLSNKTVVVINEILYSRDYTVFTYYQSRVTYNCLVDFSFDGCSTNPDFPTMYTRETRITIRPIIYPLNCTGALFYSSLWKIQRNIDLPEFRDGVPHTDYDYFGKPVYVIPPVTLHDSTHLVEYIHLLRGNPPGFGGTTLFEKVGRCYIKTIHGNIRARVSGGDYRTVSCYTTYTLRIRIMNKGYKLTEVQFAVSCDNLTDTECVERNLTVPTYNKLNTPCGSKYTFYVIIRSKLNYLPAEIVRITGSVAFKKTERSLYITCVFNCYPVDPAKKIIFLGESEPYSPFPVDWNVTVEGIPSARRADIRLFYPLAASRVYCTDGDEFVGSDTARKSWVRTATEVVVKSPDDTECSKILLTDNLAPYVANYSSPQILSNDGPYYQISPSSVNVTYTYEPGTYRVYEIENTTRGILFLNETNYQDLIIFKPHWKNIVFCVLDGLGTEACSHQYSIPIVDDKPITVEDLLEYLETTDVTLFLIGTVRYLRDGLRNGDDPMRWNLTVAERTELVNLVLQQRSIRLIDFIYMAQIISMIFYSEKGNMQQGLYPFENERSVLRDFETMMEWLRLRTRAVLLFAHTTKSVMQWSLSTDSRSFKLRNYVHGDLLSFLFESWSLGHFQGSFLTEFNDHIHSVQAEVLLAELAHHRRRLVKANTKALYDYTIAISRCYPLYYGIRALGRSPSARGWVMTSSYNGFVQAMNKSVPPHESGDFVDYFFASVNATDGTAWLDFADLLLPPPDETISNQQLSLIVILAKNRPLDDSISPYMYINLVNKDGERVKTLSNQQPYHVTLPKMLKGELWNQSEVMKKYEVRKSVDPSTRLRDFVVHKITLPAKFITWNELFYVKTNLTMKAMVTFDRLPDYEEVEAQPSLIFTNSNHHMGYIYDHLPIHYDNDSLGYVPTPFYVAVLPGSSVRTGDVMIYYQATEVEVCTARDMELGEFDEHCKGEREKEDHDARTIHCACNKFGVRIISRNHEIHRVRILMDLIPLLLPHAVRQIEVYIIPSIIAFMVLLLLVLAVFRDRRRHGVLLIHVDDTYIEDKNIVILGVFTSMRYLAGTRSTVAIKIYGNRSSSRVHLLGNKKRKTLVMGGDQWFVLTTKTSLGKISFIKLWHDFYKLSDWHCSHIYIYEPSTGMWFVAQVHRWFRIPPSLDSSTGVARIETTEVDSVDGVFLSRLPMSFGEHYLNELRNSHHLASLILLKDRSLSSLEQRSIMFIVKVLGMIFMVWVVEEKFYTWYYDRELDPIASKKLVSLGGLPIFLAFLTVIFSIPFTVPLTLAYRTNWKSRLLQRKITNPIYLQLAKPEDLVVRKKPESHRQPLRQKSPSSLKASQSSETVLSPEAVGEKKKVVFIEEPSTPMRRMSRAISDLIMRKIAWTRKSVSQNWKKHILYVFGPAQYRCVNISSEIFSLKARRRMMRIRLVASFTILTLLLAIVLVLQFTSIWTKLESLGYILVVAFFIDILIVDPLLIALNSAFMYYFLEVTNKESYIWNEDTKIQPPKPLGYKEYIQTATGAPYKPLVALEIKKKRNNEDAWSLTKAIGFYIASALAIWCCYSVLEHSYDNRHFYHIRSIKSQLEEPNNKLQRPSYYINEVVDPIIAMNYIATSVADLSMVWYNGKNISLNQQRWASNRISKPLGAANMIIVFVPNEGGKARLTKIMSRFFRSASGFLSDGDAEKGEIHLGGFNLVYMDNSFGTTSGKTREIYPLRGHNVTLPMDKFEYYYSSLLNILSDLVEDRSNYYPRVMILTYNFISAFARRVSTVDAIIEYLPSGLCTAELRVHSFLAYDVNHVWFEVYKNIMVLLLVFHFLYTASESVKYPGGVVAFFKTTNGMIKLLIYPSSLVLAIVTSFHDEYTALETIIHLPHVEYTDLHYVHLKETITAVLELIIICALVLDSFFALWNAFGAEQLKETMSIKCVHYCLIMFLMHMYISLDANVCSNVFDRKIAALELLFHIKEAVNVVKDYNSGFLIVTIMALLIFSKACTAIFVGNYLEGEHIHFERTALMRAVKKMYKNPLPRRLTHFLKRKSHMPVRKSSGSSSSSDTSKMRGERESHVERVKQTNKKFRIYFGKV